MEEKGAKATRKSRLMAFIRSFRLDQVEYGIFAFGEFIYGIS